MSPCILTVDDSSTMRQMITFTDGITLVQRLRALPEFKFTPILVLTTESDASMKMKGKEAGATGWIVKPFSPEKLLEVVNKVI